MLGEELRQLREVRGLNPTDLARLSGVSRTRLYALENGESEKPYTSTLLKIATGLSAWRTGEPDPEDCAEVFRRLQVSAGYPVDQVTSDEIATHVPAALADHMRGILESWAHWGHTERAVVVNLLKVASELGTEPPDDSGNLQHSDEAKTKMRHPNSLALTLDRIAWEGRWAGVSFFQSHRPAFALAAAW